MKLIANKKTNIKTDTGWILVMPGDIIDLPIKYKTHPALDSEQDLKNKKRIEAFKADLADDGKMNYSHNPDKGRKLK